MTLSAASDTDIEPREGKVQPLRFSMEERNFKILATRWGIDIEADPGQRGLDVTATLAGGRMAKKSMQISMAPGDVKTGDITPCNNRKRINFFNELIDVHRERKPLHRCTIYAGVNTRPNVDSLRLNNSVRGRRLIHAFDRECLLIYFRFFYL